MSWLRTWTGGIDQILAEFSNEYINASPFSSENIPPPSDGSMPFRCRALRSLTTSSSGHPIAFFPGH